MRCSCQKFDVTLIMRKQLGESRMPNIWPGFLKGVNIMMTRKRTRANSTLKDTNQKDVTAKCNMWTLNGSELKDTLKTTRDI